MTTPHLHPPPAERGEVGRGVEPKCIYFGTCGGCAFQDLDYSEQLEVKRQSVEEALNGFGSFPIHPTIPSPKPYHYRHMVAMTVKRRHNALHLGFVAGDQTTFLPIESCPIADERINKFLPEALIKLEGLPPERKFHTSQVVLRIGNDGEVVTSLRTDRGRKLEAKIGGKIFSYSMSSFFQNNFSILESFVKVVRMFLNPPPLSSPRKAGGGREGGRGTLFDLYSGVGFLGISLADSYKRAVGIEEGFEAVQHAKQNAERNGVKNVSFLEGKVEKLLPELTAEIARPFHVIIDPPRKGLKPEVIECLTKLPIDRLVYVSCSLEALRRDLQLLTDRFQIVEVQPLDFFPQTNHIETVVLLKPR